MADTYSAEVRSRTMRAVKAQDTGPEVLLRKALWAQGARGWRCHRARLPGKPDIAFGSMKLAVFVDGAFWHGHPDHYWEGRSGPYWDAKIARNRERDRRVDAQLKEAGWVVLRVWDFDVERDPAEAARRVVAELERVGSAREVEAGYEGRTRTG